MPPKPNPYHDQRREKLLHGHHLPRTRLAVVSDGVDQGQPVTRVIYGESVGFTLLDAEMADEDPDDHELTEFHVICESCVIDKHPEAAGGMDLAQRSGGARYREGAWIAEEGGG